MLLFNRKQQTAKKFLKNFNTSNVTIQPPPSAGTAPPALNFNTSNVTIQLAMRQAERKEVLFQYI